MKLVSVHGGHSGQFCTHATDSLEEIVCEYIRQGFSQVGISEHAPALSDQFLYEDDRECGMDATRQWRRFAEYIKECRRLQRLYRNEISLYVAIETETCTGSDDFTRRLVQTFAPDYLVGSVHHVADINFDFSCEYYRRAAEAAGGITELYCAYFDAQHKMIARLKPAVVGHFDLIRLFDPDYRTRLAEPAVHERIERNLHQIAALGLTLDYNQRPLLKGAAEPCPTAFIFERALELGIPLLPGDDSHGVSSCGSGVRAATRHLVAHGVEPDWPLFPATSE